MRTLTIRDLLCKQSQLQARLAEIQRHGSVCGDTRGASAEFDEWMKSGGMKSAAASEHSAVVTIAQYMERSNRIMDDFIDLQRRIDPQGETLQQWERKAAEERNERGRASRHTLAALKLLRAAQ